MMPIELRFRCTECDEYVDPVEIDDTLFLFSHQHDCLDERVEIATVTDTEISVIHEDYELEATIPDIYPPDYEEHVLQWAMNDDDEVIAAHIIPDHETSNAVTLGRAQMKMAVGHCHEVAGASWTIDKLRTMFDQLLSPEVREGESDD